MTSPSLYKSFTTSLFLSNRLSKSMSLSFASNFESSLQYDEFLGNAFLPLLPNGAPLFDSDAFIFLSHDAAVRVLSPISLLSEFTLAFFKLLFGDELPFFPLLLRDDELPFLGLLQNGALSLLFGAFDLVAEETGDLTPDTLTSSIILSPSDKVVLPCNLGVVVGINNDAVGLAHCFVAVSVVVRGFMTVSVVGRSFVTVSVVVRGFVTVSVVGRSFVTVSVVVRGFVTVSVVGRSFVTVSVVVRGFVIVSVVGRSFVTVSVVVRGFVTVSVVVRGFVTVSVVVRGFVTVSVVGRSFVTVSVVVRGFVIVSVVGRSFVTVSVVVRGFVTVSVVVRGFVTVSVVVRGFVTVSVVVRGFVTVSVVVRGFVTVVCSFAAGESVMTIGSGESCIRTGSTCCIDTGCSRPTGSGEIVITSPLPNVFTRLFLQLCKVDFVRKLFTVARTGFVQAGHAQVKVKFPVFPAFSLCL